MLSFHSSLVCERMSGDREATSDRPVLVRLDIGDDEVCSLGYAPSTKYQANPQERELSADFSEEEEGEEEVEEKERKKKGTKRKKTKGEKKLKREEEERRLRLLFRRVTTTGHSFFLVSGR